MKRITHGGWEFILNAEYADEKLTRYTISGIRKVGDWYDEIRYDSHDRRKGRLIVAPHFHLKLRSTFKVNQESALEELQSIIGQQLISLKDIVEK